MAGTPSRSHKNKKKTYYIKTAANLKPNISSILISQGLCHPSHSTALDPDLRLWRTHQASNINHGFVSETWKSEGTTTPKIESFKMKNSNTSPVHFHFVIFYIHKTPFSCKSNLISSPFLFVRSHLFFME